MRSILACFVIPVLLSGCAAQGTIVEKRSRLRPDSTMIGTEGVNSFVFRGPRGSSRPPINVLNPQFWAAPGGSYKFVLRDRTGNVHSQLVTPDVFVRYNVGDYFNDMLPPIEATDAKTSPLKSTASRQHTSHRKTQVAQKHRSHRKLANHRHRVKKHKALARQASARVRQS